MLDSPSQVFPTDRIGFTTTSNIAPVSYTPVNGTDITTLYDEWNSVNISQPNIGGLYNVTEFIRGVQFSIAVEIDTG